MTKMPRQTAQGNSLTGTVMSDASSLPPGVINLFNEFGAEGSKQLVASANVPVISFTGSTATGRPISTVGAGRLKRYGLELGVKTPDVVFDDANLDAALPVLEQSLTVFGGTVLYEGSRLLVQRSVAVEVRSKRLRAVRVGPASDPTSERGPMIYKANVSRVKQLDKAISEGASVIVRGGPVLEGEFAKGAFYRPAMLEVQNSKLDIVQHETFGPVLTIQVFDTEAEAITLANESEYGLAA